MSLLYNTSSPTTHTGTGVRAYHVSTSLSVWRERRGRHADLFACVVDARGRWSTGSLEWRPRVPFQVWVAARVALQRKASTERECRAWVQGWRKTMRSGLRSKTNTDHRAARRTQINKQRQTPRSWIRKGIECVLRKTRPTVVPRVSPASPPPSDPPAWPCAP